MANPRKFSEKIALHTQRQAEETAIFEQIMREVLDVTAKVLPERGSAKHNTLRVSQTLGTFRGGSLPNVSAGGQIAKAPASVKDAAKPEQLDGSFPPATNHYNESRSRPVGVGPMRLRPAERRIDTSPYSSGTYLSPPPDTSWRRTNSDSALHQSAMQGLSQDRANSGSTSWMPQLIGGEQNDGRPRSSCDVPRVPGIHIYPSAQDPGAIQIPIGNNTGSLPDLTNFHFPSPLHAPIDHEGEHSSSPYSSSPVSASPATLSPTSLPPGPQRPHQQQQPRFQFSPHHQVQPQQHHQHQHHQHQSTPLYNHQHHYNQHPSSPAHNHLSVPNNHRYMQRNKNLPLENSLTGLIDGNDFNATTIGTGRLDSVYQTQQQQTTTAQQSQTPQQQCSPSSPSPTMPHSISKSGYRSPLARPSPQSSPSLSRHSAPSSPAGPSPLPDYYVNQNRAAQLQQHFEQFTMMDSPAVTAVSYGTASSPVHHNNGGGTVNNGSSGNGSPGAGASSNNNNGNNNVGSNNGGGSNGAVNTAGMLSDVTATDLTNDVNYYSSSPAPLVYTAAVNAANAQSHHTTPNTPTSIPDIILTDYSITNARDDLTRQEFSRDLPHVISESLESELFSGDIGPLSFDELRMLSDPDTNVIPDSAEDHFRLDRLE